MAEPASLSAFPVPEVMSSSDVDTVAALQANARLEGFKIPRFDPSGSLVIFNLKKSHYLATCGDSGASFRNELVNLGFINQNFVLKRYVKHKTSLKLGSDEAITTKI